MERLTKRDKEGQAHAGVLGYYNMIDKLADYEDAEEQGRLFILPLVVGDIAYTFRTYKGITHVQPGIVSEVSFTKDMKPYYVVRGVARGILGEKVFPTEEEAEAKLASLRGYR